MRISIFEKETKVVIINKEYLFIGELGDLPALHEIGEYRIQ